ncbi:ArsR family transcriptional regulator [Candidatus Thorarchaeota archaeon]|nr:MAG: ArsR family transcriptional regulator [Candidatus Thorarchaeota archaeon]
MFGRNNDEENGSRSEDFESQQENTTSSSVDEIKKELEEVRRLKETLKEEIDEVRSQKTRRERIAKTRRHHKAPRPPHPPNPYVDLSGLTESLEHMMEGLGEQIEASMRGIEGIDASFKFPQISMRRRGRSARRKDIENIPPDRVAEVISPLGSEERLNILKFLKDGSKTFNELENYTGKTGSSLTHHLNPLLDAGYVIKGEVRGTYYVTVEGRLAYRLAQWLTSRLEQERNKNGKAKDSPPEDDEESVENSETREGEVEIDFSDEEEF